MTRPLRSRLTECTGYALHFYDAGLGKNGSDKFYHAFFFLDDDRSYIVVLHWGRDGSVGQVKQETVSTYMDAKRLMDKKLNEKLRGGYEKLGEGTTGVDLTVAATTAAAVFALAVSERDADKSRMTGGIIIHEEPDLMDLLG